MKACNECPFRKDSKKGFTTTVSNREGTFAATMNVVYIKEPFGCHMNPKKMCRGSILFIENKYAMNSHENIFASEFEMLEHHCHKESLESLAEKHQSMQQHQCELIKLNFEFAEKMKQDKK